MTDTIVEKVTFNEHTGQLDFHIPDPFKTGEKVVSVGKDQIKKILKEVFPSELRSELGGALKNVEDEVIHEVVQKVILPVLSEVLKPVEKLAFSIGARGMQIAYDTTKDLVKLAPPQYKLPEGLFERAEGYAKNIEDGIENPWLWWLSVMGVAGYDMANPSLLTPIEYFKGQQEIWSGWEPFVDALVHKEHDGYSQEEIIADFNKTSFYAANAGNLSLGFYWNNLYDRAPVIIEELKKYDDGLPIKRGAIREFITKLGPSAMDITASAKIEIGLSIGGSLGLWGIPTRLCIHMLDEILKEAGVPE